MSVRVSPKIIFNDIVRALVHSCMPWKQYNYYVPSASWHAFKSSSTHGFEFSRNLMFHAHQNHIQIFIVHTLCLLMEDWPDMWNQWNTFFVWTQTQNSGTCLPRKTWVISRCIALIEKLRSEWKWMKFRDNYNIARSYLVPHWTGNWVLQAPDYFQFPHIFLEMLMILNFSIGEFIYITGLAKISMNMGKHARNSISVDHGVTKWQPFTYSVVQ